VASRAPGAGGAARDPRVAHATRHRGQGSPAACRPGGPGRLWVAAGASSLDAPGDDTEVDPGGCRRVAAADGRASTTSPHAPCGAKGPDRACAPGGGRGVCAASVHPAAHIRGAGGWESVGGGPCQGVSAGVFGGCRLPWLSLSEAAHPSRLAHASLSRVDGGAHLRWSGRGRDDTGIAVLQAVVSHSICEGVVTDRRVAHAQATPSGHRGKSLREQGVPA